MLSLGSEKSITLFQINLTKMNALLYSMRHRVPTMLLLTFILFTSNLAFGQDDNDCDGYRTQTPGGWGAPANGNNPGVYRDANFDSAFPDGLVVGCEENSLTLTSASAVQNFLPCGGSPSILDQSYTDPDCIGTVFAGHLVALTLSVEFDANDPDFGEADGLLGELIYNSGPFEGWTINEVLAEANQVFGGCSSDYSPTVVRRRNK